MSEIDPIEMLKRLLVKVAIQEARLDILQESYASHLKRVDPEKLRQFVVDYEKRVLERARSHAIDDPQLEAALLKLLKGDLGLP